MRLFTHPFFGIIFQTQMYKTYCISQLSLTTLQMLNSFIRLVAPILGRSAIRKRRSAEGVNQQSGILWKDDSVSSALDGVYGREGKREDALLSS